MFEVENKYRVADEAPLRAKLLEWHAEATPPRRESDHYFGAPDRDLAKTDEVLRLRTCDSQTVLTYKGPKGPGAAKARQEIELSLSAGGDSARAAVQFLLALRYRPVAVVEKTRQVYRCTRGGFAVEVCFDRVGAIGSFVEIEVLAEESRRAEATAVVVETAAELGLGAPEERSYLAMVLAQPVPAGRGS